MSLWPVKRFVYLLGFLIIASLQACGIKKASRENDCVTITQASQVSLTRGQDALHLFLPVTDGGVYQPKFGTPGATYATAGGRGARYDQRLGRGASYEKTEDEQAQEVQEIEAGAPSGEINPCVVAPQPTPTETSPGKKKKRKVPEICSPFRLFCLL